MFLGLSPNNRQRNVTKFDIVKADISLTGIDWVGMLG